MSRLVRLRFVDDQFLTRSQSGAIWGHLYFEIGEAFFPDSGWTDLVPAFLTAWLEALTRIAAASSEKERVRFFDGPFAIDLRSSDFNVVESHFVHKDVAKHSANIGIGELLENALTVSKEVLSSCGRRGWSESDVQDLASAIDDASKTVATRNR